MFYLLVQKVTLFREAKTCLLLQSLIYLYLHLHLYLSLQRTHVNVCTSLFSDLGRGKSMCVLLRGAYKMGKNVARSGH